MNPYGGWRGCAFCHKRYGVTHYGLDAAHIMRHDIGVKIYCRPCTALLLGALALLPACEQQGTNIAKLNELQRRNAALRMEIADMHALIQRAGADVPGLADQLDALSREERLAYENRSVLKAKETDLRLRRIELEGRLETFRTTFNELQKQISTSPTPEQP